MPLELCYSHLMKTKSDIIWAMLHLMFYKGMSKLKCQTKLDSNVVEYLDNWSAFVEPEGMHADRDSNMGLQEVRGL